MTSWVRLRASAIHAAQLIKQGFHTRRSFATWEQCVLGAVPARRWRAEQHAACAIRCTPARLPVPARGCRTEEVESERADRLREGSSGGVPFPPGRTRRFSAYITCRSGARPISRIQSLLLPPCTPAACRKYSCAHLLLKYHHRALSGAGRPQSILTSSTRLVSNCHPCKSSCGGGHPGRPGHAAGA